MKELILDMSPDENIKDNKYNKKVYKWNKKKKKYEKINIDINGISIQDKNNKTRLESGKMKNNKNLKKSY